jgi:hypothetical protein
VRDGLSPFALCQPGDPIELQEIFIYFATKFDLIPEPRSVAEARISQADISYLCQWFSALYGKPKNWCDRDWQEDLLDGRTASSREMFGALFVILASELCRELSTEDSVWPTVAGVMKADRLSYSILFVGGQPTEACKLAIAAGARRLRLRNLIDRHGTQEYFDTLKLQFGFTFKGAQRRLVDWLDGLPSPMAVDILRSADAEYHDLSSETFQEAWRTLLDFRKRRITESIATARLQKSPWIRQGRKSLRLCLAELRIRGFDTIAEASELPDHFRRALLLRLFGNRRAPFFVTNSLVQD